MIFDVDALVYISEKACVCVRARSRVCVCVRVCACVYVRANARARAGACARACARACVCARACMRACARASFYRLPPSLSHSFFLSVTYKLSLHFLPKGCTKATRAHKQTNKQTNTHTHRSPLVLALGLSLSHNRTKSPSPSPSTFPSYLHTHTHTHVQKTGRTEIMCTCKEILGVKVCARACARGACELILHPRSLPCRSLSLPPAAAIRPVSGLAAGRRLRAGNAAVPQPDHRRTVHDSPPPPAG